MSEIDWSNAPEWADRVVKPCMSTLLYWANNQQREMVKNRKRSYADDTHIRDNWEVVERRPISNTVRVNARIAPVETWYPIEQRIASLRALEKQVEETRAELTRDLETLGLMWMVRDEPEQPTITDWRDLRVGDVIMIDYVNGDHIGGDRKLALEGRESIIVSDGDLYPVCVTNDSYPKGHSLNMKGAVENGCRWRFIRRP